MSWEIVKLEDVCQVVGGTTPSTTNQEYWNGDIIWLSPTDLPEVGVISDITNSKRKITQQALKEAGLLLLPVNSLVFSTRASIGKIGIVKNPLCTNQGFTNFIPGNTVYSKYLAYVLKNNIAEIEKLGNTTTFKEVSRTAIKNFQIPLPPLPIQKRIAEILDAADALKRKDQELLKKYDELAQAIFIDMFGDPVKNEKGWEVKPISKLGKISTGNTPSRAESANFDDKHIEWIKTDNIEESSLFVSNSSEYLSEIGVGKGRTIPAGSLLIACIAGSIESIGRAALTDREVSFNQQINAIEPNENVNSLFLYFLFKYSRKHVQNHASNGMKRMLSKGAFEKIKMIVPKIHKQVEFENKIGQLILQKERMRNTFLNSENLFNSLIQKAFKGELVS